METKKAINCPKCGGPLEVAAGDARFKCPYCGTEGVVDAGGTAVIAPAAPAPAPELQGAEEELERLIQERARLLTEADRARKALAERAKGETRYASQSGLGQWSWLLGIVLIGCGFITFVQFNSSPDLRDAAFCAAVPALLGVGLLVFGRVRSGRDEQAGEARRQATREEASTLEQKTAARLREVEQRIAVLSQQVQAGKLRPR